MEQLIKITAAEPPATSPGNPSGRLLEERANLVRRGRRLEYFTIAWNSLEGLVAILSGLIAGSIALVGFGGLLLNALLGWWWADPIATIVMAPIIAKEGVEALRGKTCCDEGSCH